MNEATKDVTEFPINLFNQLVVTQKLIAENLITKNISQV